GKQKRAFTYIEDCLEPFWNAGTDPIASSQIINLGGKIESTINDAADVLIQVMGGGKKEFLDARHEVKDAWPTWQKSVDILNYKENHDLKSGLSKMWEWAQKQPIREQRVWEVYELDKGMYDYWKV
ncbi:MAG: hypothetical protein IIB40_12215, partial [Candidatus Marinimicrobia bacterium]|nr:hypothetical protein [Candidatus Neomarinimicrobiota bacterium]